MRNAIEVYLFAILQGATELFPVSSLGHGILVPYLFNLSGSNSPPLATKGSVVCKA